jgi:hypothetical protein
MGIKRFNTNSSQYLSLARSLREVCVRARQVNFMECPNAMFFRY